MVNLIQWIALVLIAEGAMSPNLATAGHAGNEQPTVPQDDGKAPPAGEGEAGKGAKVRAASRKGAVALGDRPVQIALKLAPDQPDGKPVGMIERVRSLRSGGRLQLILRGVRTDAPPGVLYNVYLDLPPDATPEQMKAHRIGVFNYFNHVLPPDSPPKADRPISLDATKIARQLLSEGKLQDKPVVTIAPAGKPVADAKPFIGEVALVEL